MHSPYPDPDSTPGYRVLPDGRVRFVFEAPQAKEVALAADFTRWAAGALAFHRLVGTGLWVLETPPLERGPHYYQFIVDGEWQQDPSHPIEEDNGLDGWNSMLAVGGATLGEQGDLRAASLNLHTWQEKNAIMKLEQTAYALARLDAGVIALQEVGEHMMERDRPNAGDVIASYLHRYTGRPWHHVWRFAHVGFEVYREGLSILSPDPIEDVQELVIGEGYLRRLCLLATCSNGGRRYRVANAHLSEPFRGGVAQTETMVGMLEQDAAMRHLPGILLTDLNARGHEASMELLSKAGWLDACQLCRGDDGPTFFGEPPVRRIDYQFVHASGHGWSEPPRCVGYHRLFDRNILGDCYLPVVSDHAGTMGVYRLPG